MWLGMVLLAFVGLASAGPAQRLARAQMEASMLVTGDVEVNAQGKVERYTLNESDRLTGKIRVFVDANVRQWQFEPILVDGRPATMRNRMGLRLVLTPVEGNFRIELRQASFYPAKEEGYEVERVKITPPHYPAQAAAEGVRAEVYLVVRIGRDGAVEDVVAEQVNLKTNVPVKSRERWRGMFARNAVDQARQWLFRPPSMGEESEAAWWDVRIPVNYMLGDDSDGYGAWIAYIPGPRQAVPWRIGDDPGSPEALAGGGVYLLGDRPGTLRLATPKKADG